MADSDIGNLTRTVRDMFKDDDITMGRDHSGKYFEDGVNLTQESALRSPVVKMTPSNRSLGVVRLSNELFGIFETAFNTVLQYR